MVLPEKWRKGWTCEKGKSSGKHVLRKDRRRAASVMETNKMGGKGERERSRIIMLNG